MGIFPNVLMEYPVSWLPWSSDSLADALAEIKRRFDLDERTDHDDFLRDLLERRLVPTEGRYVWPQAMRTALLSGRSTRKAGPSSITTFPFRKCKRG